MYRLVFILLANLNFNYTEPLQDQINILKQALEQQSLIIKKLQQRVVELETSGSKTKTANETALENYLSMVEGEQTSAEFQTKKAPVVRYMKSGISGLMTVGSSSQRDSELEALQGGHHNPSKRGFSLRGLEWSLFGAIDPNWDAQTHVLFSHDPRGGETSIEIEEAFARSTALSKRFQLELGLMNTEFGRFNTQHAHQWTFADQPLVNNRIFGSESMRGPGLRIGYLLPSANYSELHFGVQNASGGTMASFQNTGAHAHGEEDGAHEEESLLESFQGEDFVSSAEDLVYLLRWVYGFSFSPEDTARLGLSWLRGPGFLPDELTRIVGIDLAYKKRKLLNSGHFLDLLVEGEFIGRNAEVLHEDVKGDVDDRGFYLQGRAFWNQNWGAGLRYERAWAKSDFQEASQLAKHSPRTRISPQILFRSSEFSQFRLQYNWDDWPHLHEGKANSIWLSFDFFFGDHPSHVF